ncbi:Smr/MutS family protein [Desulfolithobacter sp.]
MEPSLVCEVCGNELDGYGSHCPYCGAACISLSPGAQAVVHRIVNLERGRPPAREALARMERELEAARLQGIRVLTLIHGYGSSGQGGVIREEVRQRLRYLKIRGAINDLLEGEEFSRRTGPGSQLLRRFPALGRHRDLGRSNPGITLVVL